MPFIINITIYIAVICVIFFNSYICYSSIKIIFMIIFINFGYITQIFIVIRIAIDNFISNIKKYKLIILYIEQVMINLNIIIQKIINYQLMQGIY